MHVSACQYFVQANTTLLDCILTQYLYDLGVLPGSAYQCILGNVYLRSDLPSICVPGHVQVPWKTCSQCLEGQCHAVKWLAHFPLHPWHGCIHCAACIEVMVRVFRPADVYLPVQHVCTCLSCCILWACSVWLLVRLPLAYTLQLVVQNKSLIVPLCSVQLRDPT